MAKFLLIQPNFRTTESGLHLYMQRLNQYGMVLSQYVCSSLYN